MLEPNGSDYKGGLPVLSSYLWGHSRSKQAMPVHEAWREGYGQRLLAAIRRKGLTQRSFAKKVGVTEGAVSRWVNGETDTDLHHLPRIASILDISLDWLLGATDVPPPPEAPRINPRTVRRAVRKLSEIRGVIDALADELPDEES